MTIEKTNKELALILIDNLQHLARQEDKEMIRLKRLENPGYIVLGESAMSHHLKTLKDLVKQLC